MQYTRLCSHAPDFFYQSSCHDIVSVQTHRILFNHGNTTINTQALKSKKKSYNTISLLYWPWYTTVTSIQFSLILHAIVITVVHEGAPAAPYLQHASASCARATWHYWTKCRPPEEDFIRAETLVLTGVRFRRGAIITGAIRPVSLTLYDRRTTSSALPGARCA